MRKAYIQPNPITRAYWLIFDIDTGEVWIDENTPLPNILVVNPVNGHQHFYYLIDPAVYTLRQARQEPLRLAADVDRGLTELLGADPGYGKLIAKNPLHERWTGVVLHEEAWKLNELIRWIPPWIRQRKVKAKEEIGLGRNCTVFETARGYAYSEWRRQKFQDDRRLIEAVYQYAMNVNSDFTVPMGEREVKCIVRSITKWTIRNVTRDGFSKWCSCRGKIGNIKSQAVRKGKSAERVMEAKALYAGGKTQKQIAAILDISERQVRTLLHS